MSIDLLSCSYREVLQPLCHCQRLVQVVIELILELIIRSGGLELISLPRFLLGSLLSRLRETILISGGICVTGLTETLSRFDDVLTSLFAIETFVEMTLVNAILFGSAFGILPVDDGRFVRKWHDYDDII
jgi:hypothetical protein